MKCLTTSIILFIMCSDLISGANRVKKVEFRIMDYIYNTELAKAGSPVDKQRALHPDCSEYDPISGCNHFYSRYFTGGQVHSDFHIAYVPETGGKYGRLHREKFLFSFVFRIFESHL